MLEESMNTIQEIQEAFNSLVSTEGAIHFMAQRTGLARERIERVYGSGDGWPAPFEELHPEFAYISAAFNGVSTVEGLDPVCALNALAQLRQMDIDSMEESGNNYLTAQERGENPPVPPEFELTAIQRDLLVERARLSGEEFWTVCEIFRADTARFAAMIGLLLRVVKLKTDP